MIKRRNNISRHVITRFAPSPSGFLHIGGYRTALFNYLFARHYKGKLILRIEDTDKERSKKEYEEDILSGLKWLGLSFDEIYRQSDRESVYQKYLKKIIDSGYAYVSKEEKKEGGRSDIIRFKNPKKKILFDDFVRGKVEFNTTELGDFVIAKSFTEPLYHLAAVVDDHEMGITDVIRGEDHISNTPRQILIQEAIGATRPNYAHLPLILAPDRSKLAKRHGARGATEYRKKGYLPEALINYLALLGWNPGTDKEIFSLDELVRLFNIEKIQKGGAIHDEVKLKWYNREYIHKLSPKELSRLVESWLKNSAVAAQKKIPDDSNAAHKIATLLSDRLETFGDIDLSIERGDLDYLWSDPDYDKDKLVWKDDYSSAASEYLCQIAAILEKIPENKFFEPKKIKDEIWDYATEKGRGSVLWPFRVALSGKEKSPDPFLIASILGKDKSIARIKNALLILKK